MSDKMKRMKMTFKDGGKKIGLLGNNEEIIPVEDFIQHIALDVVESYYEIDKGEKKREETNIDLQMEVLDSLSNALKSLGVVLYH